MNEGPVIEVKNLYKSFDGFSVLENICLKIWEGERLCIVGPTGCGKTALVRHFNGLNSPDQGEVLVYGKNLKAISHEELQEIRRGIGYVFQGNALLSEFNVYDNIAFTLREILNWKDEKKIEERVKQCLAAVELDEKDGTLMDYQLSGGMEKRAAIARTIAYNTRIIIYDEPTSGLDPGTSGTISDLVCKLHEKQKNTSIVITHDRELMEDVGDRIIMLYNGGIHFEGGYENFDKEKSEDSIISKYLGEASRINGQRITS